LKLRVFSGNKKKKQQQKIRQEKLESWVLFLQATKKSNMRIEEMGLQEMEVGRDP
jgi:hypothetical protein